MSSTPTASSKGAQSALAVVNNRFVLWCVFVFVHFWLGMLNLFGPGLPMGDVTLVYKFWIDQAISHNFWVGIDSVWVYPIVAIIPMLGAFTFGPALYASTWLTIVMGLNAVAFAVITGWRVSKNHASVAWWWLGFLVALGPIALGRIDSVTVPLAIIGMLFLASRPVAASVVLTVATWIKVWPAALLAAVVIADSRRRDIVGAAMLVSAAIVAITVLFGGGSNVFSFITQQTGRGLQVEAPVSTIWMWLAAAGIGGSRVYYDQNILTYQVSGAGADVASAVMTPLLGVVALAVCALGLVALRRGVASVELLPLLSLALVTVLIAFNKVGSPQFVMWLAVPIIIGLVLNIAQRRFPVSVGGSRRVVESFRVPATLVLFIAILTQAIYPFFYSPLLNLNPVMLLALTARNLLYFVLLAWAISELIFVIRQRSSEFVVDSEGIGFPDDSFAESATDSAPIDWRVN
jgi:hypothetical protein